MLCRYEVLHKPALHEAALEIVVGRAVLERQNQNRHHSHSASHSTAAAIGGAVTPSGSAKKSKKGGAGALSTAAPAMSASAVSAAEGGGSAGGGLGTFARTGHAMRLMERVAVGLAQVGVLLCVLFVAVCIDCLVQVWSVERSFCRLFARAQTDVQTFKRSTNHLLPLADGTSAAGGRDRHWQDHTRVTPGRPVWTAIGVLQHESTGALLLTLIE